MNDLARMVAAATGQPPAVRPQRTRRAPITEPQGPQMRAVLATLRALGGRATSTQIAAESGLRLQAVTTALIRWNGYGAVLRAGKEGRALVWRLA